MSDENPREYYKSLSNDDLAHALRGFKEQMAAMRQTCWYIEDELRDRMLTNQASLLQGNEYRVKSSLKREYVWDQGLLAGAYSIAASAGLKDEFSKAFPLKYDCSVRGLNALLKHGGDVAKAVERARVETKERLELTVEELK